MSETLPEDPISQYGTWALELHECMSSLQEAGFSPEQSFQVLLRGVTRGWFDDFDDDA